MDDRYRLSISKRAIRISSPAMIQELEGCSITVSLKAFKALDRYGYEVPEYYDEEIFYELWEMNGTPTLLDSKHS